MILEKVWRFNYFSLNSFCGYALVYFLGTRHILVKSMFVEHLNNNRYSPVDFGFSLIHMTYWHACVPLQIPYVIFTKEMLWIRVPVVDL